MDINFRKAVLKQVKTLNASELKNTLDNPDYKFTLNEFIENGLSSTQLESFPSDAIATEIKASKLEFEALEKCGISETKLNEVKNIISPPPTPTGPGVQPPLSEKEKIYTEIEEKTIRPEKLLNHLLEGTVSKSDLIENTSLSYDIVERIDKYSKQETVVPKIEELDPLAKDRTDFYFLGMPGSGKSTILASLLAYCNRNRLMESTMQNKHGEAYKKQLIQELLRGILPNSTPTELVNYIPLNIREFERKERLHPLNFIDMAGELFKKVADGGIEEFNKIKNYLYNKNRKILLFIIDYDPENTADEMFEQDHNLQMVFGTMEKFGILEKTESVYMVVSKADLFPSENKQQFADKYLMENFGNFVELCRSKKKKYGYRLSSSVYSIGPSVVNNLLVDFNHKTNTNLDIYPEKLTNIILEDSFMKKNKRFGF